MPIRNTFKHQTPFCIIFHKKSIKKPIRIILKNQNIDKNLPIRPKILIFTCICLIFWAFKSASRFWCQKFVKKRRDDGTTQTKKSVSLRKPSSRIFSLLCFRRKYYITKKVICKNFLITPPVIIFACWRIAEHPYKQPYQCGQSDNSIYES